MSQNESLNNTFSDYVYEGLVRYNKQFVPEPALATSWTRVSPTVWRFNLRKNVKFHDGTPMTADDVVFSFQRVLAPASNMKVYAQGVKEAKKIDDFTVEVVTDGPNPVLLRRPRRRQDHEQGLVDEEQRRQPAELRAEGGELRRAQHQRDRPVHAEVARGRT